MSIVQNLDTLFLYSDIRTGYTNLENKLSTTPRLRVE
jgi:hypothetical protein